MILRLIAATVCASFVLGMPAAVAQSPSPNADILKMIQAGLPETVVVNKIRSGTGHWDTSVDALIALKSAGATPAELEALTAEPAAAPAPVASMPSSDTHTSSVLGGTLETDHGKVFLHEPGNPKWDKTNLTFQLVLVDGRVAYRLRCYAETDNIPAKTSTLYGDMILEHDKVTYYPYGRIKWGFIGAQKSGQVMDRAAVPEDPLEPESYSMGEIRPQYNGDTAKLRKKARYMYYWTYFFDPKAKQTMASQEFVIDLLRDFDGTTAKVLAAAGITNPEKQLADSRFTVPDTATVRAIVEERNRDNALHGGKSK